MSVMINKISKPKGSILKGYPPGDVTNIQITPSINYVGVNYKLPVDIEICGTVLSEWQEVKLVQNNNHYPTSIDDGIPLTVATRTDTNSGTSNYVQVLYNTTITTAYFRFFVVSKTGEINDSTSMMFEGKRIVADPVLANNSWETIAAISESGQASSIWQIGDEIPVTVGEDTYTAQIWDFDHYDLSDGSGKAGITFGFKELLTETRQFDRYAYSSNSTVVPSSNSYDNNDGVDFYTDAYLINDFFNTLPLELQNIIKPVMIVCLNASYNRTQTSSAYNLRIGMVAIERKIFIPSKYELHFSGSEIAENTTDYESTYFPMFSIAGDNTSRIKYKLGDNSPSNYWTRSMDSISSNVRPNTAASSQYRYYRPATAYVCSSSGERTSSDIVVYQGICPIFNV